MSSVISKKRGATYKVIQTWGQKNRDGLEMGLEMIPFPSNRNHMRVLYLPRDE